MIDPVRTVVDALTAAWCSPRVVGEDKWSFKCPCPEHTHGDRKPSGRLGIGDDGRALLWCGRGHKGEEIAQALGLEIGSLFPDDTSAQKKGRPNLHAITGGLAPRTPAPPKVPKPGRPEVGVRGITAVYDYVNADADVVYRVGRTADKDFPTAHLDPVLGWIWGHPPNTAKVLFNLPAVLDGVARGARVFVVEGEKDAENINGAFPDRIDYVATTKMGGARSEWLPQYSTALRGAVVWIIADKDTDGTYAAAVAAHGLDGVAQELVIVESKSGKDASDHLDAGFGLEDFLVLAADGAVAV